MMMMMMMMTSAVVLVVGFWFQCSKNNSDIVIYFVLESTLTRVNEVVMKWPGILQLLRPIFLPV